MGNFGECLLIKATGHELNATPGEKRRLYFHTTNRLEYLYLSGADNSCAWIYVRDSKKKKKKSRLDREFIQRRISDK